MTSQVAVLPPSAVVAVIFAVPFDTAETRPVSSPTVATAGVSLVHVTVLFVAFAGATVAVKVSEPPGAKVSLVSLKVTRVTLIGPTVTVIAVDWILAPLPSLNSAVIVYVPDVGAVKSNVSLVLGLVLLLLASAPNPETPVNPNSWPGVTVPPEIPTVICIAPPEATVYVLPSAPDSISPVTAVMLTAKLSAHAVGARESTMARAISRDKSLRVVCFMIHSFLSSLIRGASPVCA